VGAHSTRVRQYEFPRDIDSVDRPSARAIAQKAGMPTPSAFTHSKLPSWSRLHMYRLNFCISGRVRAHLLCHQRPARAVVGAHANLHAQSGHRVAALVRAHDGGDEGAQAVLRRRRAQQCVRPATHTHTHVVMAQHVGGGGGTQVQRLVSQLSDSCIDTLAPVPAASSAVVLLGATPSSQSGLLCVTYFDATAPCAHGALMQHLVKNNGTCAIDIVSPKLLPFTSAHSSDQRFPPRVCSTMYLCIMSYRSMQTRECAYIH
jgi:hypothetical protein